VTAAVLADFGSTFTKVSLVELQSGRLLAHAQAPTTVASDVMDGYRVALEAARSALGEPVSLGPRLAASSAAGGLRVAAIGFVADLTAAAARQAALNAGARIELVLDGRLGAPALASLQRVRPEVVLFCGGTDGGQEQIVLANAEAISAEPLDTHFVVACNAGIAARVGALLARHGARVDVVANVMPRIGSLEVEPARAAISEAFVRHVIQGKGLSREPEFLREVAMATPEAVLRAARLFAARAGDIVVLDVGGATTDVHSAARTSEPAPGIRTPLLPTLPVLRTVQGDLGLRSNAPSVLGTDREWLRGVLALDDRALDDAAARRAAHPDFVAVEPQDWALDRTLASACVFHALRRHCGRLTILSQPNQPARISTDGPDLRRAPLIVGTGGILVRSPRAEEILRTALDRCDERSLTPREPRLAIDADYVLAAAGLLADVDEDAALALMRERLDAGAARAERRDADGS
jgi:uncharacterized protein (TIGR01319 family)